MRHVSDEHGKRFHNDIKEEEICNKENHETNL